MTYVKNPEGSRNTHHQCHVEELCADLIKLLRIWKILTLEILIGRRRHTCPAWISEQLELKFVVNFSHKCGYSTWSNSSDMSHHRGTENLEITFQQIFSSSISWFIRSRLLSQTRSRNVCWYRDNVSCWEQDKVQLVEKSEVRSPLKWAILDINHPFFSQNLHLINQSTIWKAEKNAAEQKSKDERPEKDCGYCSLQRYSFHKLTIFRSSIIPGWSAEGCTTTDYHLFPAKKLSSPRTRWAR